MKKILILLTGGTLASIDRGAGLEPNLKSNQILSFLPKEFTEGLDYKIETEQIFNIESSDLEPRHWTILANTIKENYKEYDGFVIVHGTDTLAYTSSALTYLIQGLDKPIVVTGSQYPIDQQITDAVNNLIQSCDVAAYSNLSGVFVVFNGHIMYGNHVTKYNSKSYSAFKSINYPNIGKIIGSEIQIFFEPKKEEFKELRIFDKLDQNILLVKFYPGINPNKILENFNSYSAIIFESYGVSGIPKEFIENIEKIIDLNIPIVITTQVLNEGTDLKRYTVGNYLYKMQNIVENKNMTIEATISKMMYALGRTDDVDEIISYFKEPIQNDY